MAAGHNGDGYDFQGFAAPSGSGVGSAISPDSSLYVDLAPGDYAVRLSSDGGTNGDYVLRILADANYATSVPVMASLAGAADTLYLDFDGHQGNDAWGSYTALPFDFNGSDSVYSPAERLAIKSLWRVTAEDFSPFDINVTTISPSSFADKTTYHMVITSSPSSIIGEATSTLGITFTGSYASGGASVKVAWVFAANFPSYGRDMSGQIMARALESGNTTSHEFGHALGLRHFLNSAQANTIMYTPDEGLNREVWATGTNSTGATQNDPATIGNATNTFGFRADDHGSTMESATVLTLTDGLATADGIIGQTTDHDFFSFAGGGEMQFRVNVDDYVNNLDAELRV